MIVILFLASWMDESGLGFDFVFLWFFQICLILCSLRNLLFKLRFLSSFQVSTVQDLVEALPNRSSRPILRNLCFLVWLLRDLLFASISLLPHVLSQDVRQL